jgi:hypothetical protein
VRDRQGTITPDRHQRIEPQVVKSLETASRVVLSLGPIRERVAPVRRTKNGAPTPENACDISRPEHAHAVRREQSVEAVFEPETLDAVIAGGFDDRADHGVQPRCIPTTGEHANT